MSEPYSTPKHLPGFTLPSHHPFAGREAYQCPVCYGIFYPDAVPTECPYCDEDDDE